MNDLFELLSLALTFPTIVTAVAVVCVWGPAAIKAVQSKEISANEYFIIGVITSFVAASIDNFYWSFFWAFEYFDRGTPPELLQFGGAFNLIFRQGLGILAAYFHLRAADLASDRKNKYANKILMFSNIGACLLVITLPVVKLWVI
jgi:putative flippase GtrA